MEEKGASWVGYGATYEYDLAVLHLVGGGAPKLTDCLWIVVEAMD